MNELQLASGILEFRDLAKDVTMPTGDKERILGPLTDVIPYGAYVAVTGPSGAGKSTLLGLLGLLDRPTSGDLEVFGEHVNRLSRRQAARLRREQIGFVFQQYHLLSRRSAIDNVAMSMLSSSRPADERTCRSFRALKAVGMEHRIDAVASTLSGGEQQRVAVARAIASEPRLILCDEPTGNLDRRTASMIMDLIEKHRGDGTLVVVTHDPAVAERADRVIELPDTRDAPST